MKILDVGCGEGTLLACLCNPSLYITRSSSQNPNADQGTEIDAEEIPELHMKKIAGLDSSLSTLQNAIESTRPPDISETQVYYSVLPRWEELDVKIWHGGLENVNEEFIGTECIVSSEV